MSLVRLLGIKMGLRERLEAFRSKARQTISGLTQDCEAAVQSGIDDINASNEALGAQLF